MSTGVVFDAVAQLHAAVDGLLGGGLDGLSGLQVAGLIEDLEVERRRLDAVDVRLVGEVDERRTAGEYGRSSTADLLLHRLRVAPGEAKARVNRARDLGPRHELSGAALDPVLPASSAALHDGEISTAHASAISRVLDAIPAEVACEAAGPAERFLVDAARHEDPARLRRTGALLLERLDPDGREPRAEDEQRRRGFTLTPCPGGGSIPSGRLTAETTALLQTVLDPLSAPVPGPDGAPDPRTPAQRRQDALRDVALRLLRSGSLPESGGVPVTVLVTTTDGDLAEHASTGGGIGRTGHGQIITLRRLLTLADSEIRYTTMSVTGEVLHHGRTKRLATVAQRRALAARDGGCCFPGCDRPAAWAETHHVIAWLDGGPTDLDNLCLVCPFHHRLLDHGDWHIAMINGRPHWKPPPWLDPEQTPIRTPPTTCPTSTSATGVTKNDPIRANRCSAECRPPWGPRKPVPYPSFRCTGGGRDRLCAWRSPSHFRRERRVGWTGRRLGDRVAVRVLLTAAQIRRRAMPWCFRDAAGG